nr:O-acyltransferase like protein-like [Leptinotarsa decemlineata]
MIAFESTWLIHLGQGPNWDMAIAEEHRNCRKNWWTNIIYMNNYIDSNNMCLHQTWYLAADTQLYTLSLFLLMLMWKNQDKIKIILGSFITLGLLVQGAVAFFKNYDIIIRQYAEVLYEMRGIRVAAWFDLYCSGYSNITGYAIGLTFGYMFYKLRNKVYCITKKHVILWWLLSFGICNFIILIAAVMYHPGYESSRLASALYWAFGKNIFALGVAVGIFGFTMKIGWFARWICEWKSVSVFGRLTYSTYIVHSAVIRIRGGLVREPVYVNDYTILMTTLGDIVLSYLAGTMMCLMFEMPISALQKLMVPQMKTKNTGLKGSSEKSLKTLDDGLRDVSVNNHEECSKV